MLIKTLLLIDNNDKNDNNEIDEAEPLNRRAYIGAVITLLVSQGLQVKLR